MFFYTIYRKKLNNCLFYKSFSILTPIAKIRNIMALHVSSFVSNTSSQTQKIYLDHAFGNKSRVSLSMTEIFTQTSLQELIEESLRNNKDYVFIIIEDTSSKSFVYDGVAFCTWLSKLPANEMALNPATQQPIYDGKFYIVKKGQDLASLHEGNGVEEFCGLHEYLNVEEYPFYQHFLSLLDDNKKSDHPLLEWHIALDLLLGRGMISNREEAVHFAKAKAEAGNPYCQIFMACCLRKGIAGEKNNAQADYFYSCALKLLDEKEVQEYYVSFKTALNKHLRQQQNNPTPPNPLQLYLSHRAYMLIKI